MDRRTFLAAGAGVTVAAGCTSTPLSDEDVRAQFPRLRSETYLNAAAGTPLGRFAEKGLRRYEEFWRLGPGDGREAALRDVLNNTCSAFAGLVGADPSEIGLVHCTKAGEQIVLDGLKALRTGGNVVTNDLHFSGSLHNLEGLRRAGLPVRVVRSDERDIPLEAMERAIDDRTALVCVTLVSNVNGRIEPVRELAKIAHAHGAYVYADIIQAAGIVPVDLRSLDVDFAACSGYKWLYGPHGCGFFYVRKELQGSALVDRIFPGHVRHNYVPWVATPDPSADAFTYAPPVDARRYEPGHVSYFGYSALLAGVRFLYAYGVDRALAHSVRLVKRLHDRLDPDRYPCLSPHRDRSPIIAFRITEPERLEARLRAARVTVALAPRRMRVSPALYNDDADIDRLVAVLNAS